MQLNPFFRPKNPKKETFETFYNRLSLDLHGTYHFKNKIRREMIMSYEEVAKRIWISCISFLSR